MPATRFIGIVCGLKSEAAAVRAAAREGKVRIAVSGASAARAETLAAMFCREGARAIVSIGVSGGLAPHLRCGDLLFGDVVRTRSGEEFFASQTLIASLETAGITVAIQRATLFGADAIVATAREKAALFERYGALAVDMESHGAARAARAFGIPFAAIRAIADPAGCALPPAALHAVAPDGGARIFSVLMECAKEPGQLPALLRLGADSRTALKTLRRGLGGLFAPLFLSLDL